jgi:hypothetical protein
MKGVYAVPIAPPEDSRKRTRLQMRDIMLPKAKTVYSIPPQPKPKIVRFTPNPPEERTESEDENVQAVTKDKENPVREKNKEKAKSKQKESPGKSKELSSELPYIKVPEMKHSTLPKGPPQRDSTPDTKDPVSYKRKLMLEGTHNLGDLVEDLLDTEYNVTLADLLKFSPMIRSQVKKRLSVTRVPADQDDPDVDVLLGTAEENEKLPFQDDPLEQHNPQRAPESEEYLRVLPTVRAWVVKTATQGLPKGAVVIPDPVQQYLENLPTGEVPKKIYVAVDTTSLRAIYPMINGLSEEESIVDGGSQIVCMSEETARRLRLVWDPDFVINVQSANTQLEKTLGLAKNVPFRFDDVTLYLQVHIVRQAPYKVLLGRPFDTLTESEVKNTTDGGQTITITDPNTKRRCTIPTSTRGEPRIISKTSRSDFPHSMN